MFDKEETNLKIVKIYELPMFATLFSKSPKITMDGLDVFLELEGYDNDDNHSSVVIKFGLVVDFRKTNSKLTIIGEAYDTLIELIDSEKLEDIKKIAKKNIHFDSLRHFAIYLDSYDLYEIICEDIAINEKLK